MRKLFAETLAKFGAVDERIALITADLGFNALEELRDALGERFIDAGVTEPHMISLGAGMAREGMRPFLYSIAPFISLRGVEHFRNDCMYLNLPVTLVGYGGGYTYGIHGHTHHVVEDIGVMRALGEVRIYVPAFKKDVAGMLSLILSRKEASYLRLMRSLEKTDVDLPYAAVRRWCGGGELTVVSLGSMVVFTREACETWDRGKIDEWVVTELPTEMPEDFWESLRRTKKLLIVEECRRQGGLGDELYVKIVERGINVISMAHLAADGYVSKLWGSQQFHLAEHGLDVKGIRKAVKWLLKQ